jgi:spore germination cell wall hydrolase CwlJ-like protein
MGEDYQRAETCLSEAVYYEAASEPLAGQRAVAQVVLNRVRRAGFPKSVCGVVYDGARRVTGCQFTFTCDGSLSHRPAAGKWAIAQSVAADALAGRGSGAVGDSTHYHASWMVPYWRASMIETARIGGHVFYRTPGQETLGAAYAGPEPVVAMANSRPAQSTARRAAPSTFAVWGLSVATVTPVGKGLVIRSEQ